MATGVGFGFDLSFLKELDYADKRLDVLLKKSNQLSSNVTKAFLQMTNQGVLPFVDSLKQQKKALEEVGNIKNDGTNKIFSKIQRQAQNTVDEINKVLQALQKTKGYKDEASGRSALSFANKTLGARGDKSIDNLRKALTQLEAAQNRQNLNTKTGQKNYEKLAQSITRVKSEIDKVTGSTENLEKSHSKLLDTSGQLARAMAAVFSVSAIKGYVNKLMQIRGEFELQQRSLQVLLQNKDEANALWDKTVALAVKSPYTTKQLVTATKQLAAYRVESEKLYETNKMLADVSIGLGVDMNRLILAFGQVKAANFLRGTELRQFSEAGVNMLDELAKRFTALEGRAVSVGEVFERVSKRMVSFADVEAVFKTITSEGGTFYQMQEKQSETLKGMMLNLKDSYELMLNDIGKSNEDTLKGFVSMMKSIVDNWRALEPYIKTAGLTFIAYFGATQIAKLVSWFGKLATAVRSFGTASAAATAINPWIALATVIGAVAAAIYSVVTATDEITAAMLEVEKNVTDSISESITLYKKLTDTINDVTKSSEERNKAYDDLRSKFEEILPDEYLELQYIEDKVNGYEAARSAMISFYNAKSIEQKRAAATRKIDEDIYGTDIPELATQFKQEFEQRFGTVEAAELSKRISSWLAEATEKAASGEIEVNQVRKYVDKLISEYLEMDVDSSKWGDDVLDLFNRQYADLIKSIWDKKEALEFSSGMPYSTLDETTAGQRKQKMQEEIKLVEDYFAKLARIYDRVAKGELNVDMANVDADKLWNEILGTKNIEKYVPILENALEKLGVAATKGSYEYTKALNDIKSELYSGEQGFASMAFEVSVETDGAAKDMFKNFGEELEKEGEKALRGDMQKAIVSAFDYAIDKADLSDASKNMLTKFIPDNKQTTSTVRQNIEGFIKQIGELKQQYDTATKRGAPFVPSDDEQRAMDKYLQGNVELLANYDELLPVLKHIYALLGGEEKNKKGELEKLKKQIQLVTELADAYEKLRKEFGKQYADENIWDSGRMAAFGEVGLDYRDFAVGTAQDEINNLEKLIPYAETLKGGYLEVARAMAKAHTELDSFNQSLRDKSFAREFEKMFGNYELTLDMEKLNIPPELAQQFLGVIPTSLKDIRDKTLEWYGLGGMKGNTNQDIMDSQAFANLSDARRKQVEDNLAKIEDLNRKSAERIMKQYSKYIIKGFNERIRLKIEELREIERVEELYRNNILTKSQADAMKKGIQDEYNTKILKQEWEEFEKSSQYLNLFDDIENSSNAALRSMLSHLESLKQSMIAAGLPASDLKKILNQIEKVEEELEERTPFATFGKDLGTAVGKIGEYIQARKKEKKLLKDIENLRQKEKELSPQVAKEQDNAKNNPLYKKLLDAQAFLATLEEGTHEYGIQEKAVEALYKVVYPVTTEHQEITEQIDETNQKLDDAQSKTKKWKDAVKGIGGDLIDFGNHLKEVGSFVSDMAQKWEQAFGLSDKAKEDMETIANIAQSSGDMAIGIGNAIANPADIGAYMQAASGLMGVFATFGQAHDKGKERQIEREMKLVKRLQEVYEDLGDTIKNAYSIDTLNEATKMSRENIMAQIEATNKMIEAEEGKKDTDWERIEDWKEDIEELKESMKELEETRLQELGAFATDENKKSGAEAFLDAWMEAYKQTGDGLSGLNKQFDDFFEDMIKKQLLQRGSNKYLEGFFSYFDEKITENAEKTPENMAAALNDIMDYWNKTKGGYNEMLKQLAEKLGVAESLAGKDAELSGLQAGIQGITEDQADVLASYWNSVRGYTADTNTKVTELSAKLFSDDTTANPMLSQLLTIAEQTRSIRDLFDSVVGHGNGGTHSGAYLKVAVG